MIPAIIFSSHTMGLSLIRSLGLEGVPIIVFYYYKYDMGYVSKYVKEKIFTPHPEEDERGVINILLENSVRFKGSILIPADDATLKVVSKHKTILSEHYIVACPDWDIVEKCVNKRYTYMLAESVGVPIPKTIKLHSRDDVERYGNDITYPYLIKPCQGHIYFDKFGKKMVKVNDITELMSAYLEAESSNIEVMLQEYIPGDYPGVNYNSYFVDNNPVIEFTAVKCRMAPPEFGIPRVVRSIKIPEIIEPGRKILQAIGFYGYSCTEFKRDARDGIYKLMEVNGRHNRSGLLSLKCGINIPYIEYKYLTTGELPKYFDAQSDVYWIDEISDIINGIRYFSKEKYSLSDYVTPYLKTHIFSVFDIKDPKPFFKRILDVIKIIFLRIISLTGLKINK